MNKLRPAFFLIIFFSNLCFPQNKTFKVSGKVLNSSTNDPLENCNIYIAGLKTGTSSDNYGNFKISLPSGKYEIRFSYVGFNTLDTTLNLVNQNINMKILLKPTLIKSNEVEVAANKEPSSIVQQKIESKELKKMPTIYSDVLRSVQTLAGVSTNTELSSGYNVRGGSFDENLIYLNGYEIYRPFLLRIGIEESQTIINPSMVDKLTFYNGAFPASFGDRMSSALEVDYKKNYSKNLSGSFYASLLNTGLNLNNKIDKFNWSFGLRYAYPSEFLKGLQERGEYKPFFSDVQFLGSYDFSTKSRLEFLGIYAVDRFEMEPKNWIGGFGYKRRDDYRGINIKSSGYRNYSYLNNLLGIRYENLLNDKSKLKISLSRYWINEKEDYDLSSDIYYFPVYAYPEENLEYLKSRYNKGNNSVKMDSYRWKAEYNTDYKIHNLSFGAEYRITDVKNYSYENFHEESDSKAVERPINENYRSSYNLNSLNFYIEDYILLSSLFEANIGLRYLRYNYSKENLISPRAYVLYKLSQANSFKFSWGYYYQPPFINELRSTKTSNLKSQRAIHYVLGWEYKPSDKSKYKVDLYYKDLSNLIPFYFDDFRMVYVETNNREGFAYGLDFMYEGELVEGVKSWIGYSFLNTQDRKTGTDDSYQRRLLDQTHTIQIFLQDRFRKHRNWQSHVRFLFGSGYQYYQRKLVTDETTGESYIEVNFKRPEDYFLYFRVDMGLSASFDLGNNFTITPTAELLNVFNQSNDGAYEWVQIFTDDIQAPIGVPHLLSPRFFNFKVELTF